MNKNTQSKPQKMLQIEKETKQTVYYICNSKGRKNRKKKQLYISLLFKTNA